MRKPLALLILLGILLLAACGEPEPVRIGFLGGLSDRNTDVGDAGRNGVILAVEQWNREGGIQDRPIELIARDDAQKAGTAARAAAELGQARVEAVIGPFTSAMAAAALPVLARSDTLLISPTLSAMAFYAKDDNLVRINRSTRDNAGDYARMLYQRGQRRVAVAYDTRNRVFSESWLEEFRHAFTTSGGAVVAEVDYYSQPDTDFAQVVRRMLRNGPDGLLYVAGAIDVARLAQQSRQQAPRLPIAASEWAASEQLLELGGSLVEGLLILQNYNRYDESPRYVAFRDTFAQRFQRLPGYSAVAAYDAATVLFTALSRRQRGDSVKAALLKYGPYQGLQQQISFDAFGDTTRQAFFTEIRQGRFVLVR